jgi:hypothetical protein
MDNLNNWNYSDCLLLVKILKENFSFKELVSAKSKDQHLIYIKRESMEKLREIVKPYIISEMLYKILLLYNE